jgi:RNA polymerase sigma factor (sigma-70 family)
MKGGTVDRSQDQFSGLYRRYYEPVSRYVQRRVPVDAVRDVVADAFLVAWRRWDDIPAGDPLPWLYGVARLTVSNYLRTTGRASSLTQRLAVQPAAAEYSLAEDVVTQLTLLAAFDRLNASDQEVLQLVAWENLDARAAAEALGCSLPTFRMKLSRARKRLKAALERLGADSDDPARAGLPRAVGQPKEPSR